MLTFAIGDTHGCLDPLSRLLDDCRRFAKGQPTTFVFLGDYIDRGPDSRGVIQTIMDLQAADPNRVIAIAGNHEDLLLRADNFIDEARWVDNGGDATLRSYGIGSMTELPPDHLAWIHNLPTHYDDGQRFFVHAGIRPGIPLDQQTREDMFWIREPFLSSTDDHGLLVVHGHTPQRDGKPDIHPNRINIDTGAVFGRNLTAAIFTDSGRMPVHFLKVGKRGPATR